MPWTADDTDSPEKTPSKRNGALSNRSLITPTGPRPITRAPGDRRVQRCRPGVGTACPSSHQPAD
jgi:hypothetical protein